MRSAGLVAVFAWLALPDGTVTVKPVAETGPAHHPGDTADDSCLWIHPTDPALSTLLGDDKDGGVMVWDLAGKELQYLDEEKAMNNIDRAPLSPRASSSSTTPTTPGPTPPTTNWSPGNRSRPPSSRRFASRPPGTHVASAPPADPFFPTCFPRTPY